MVWHCHCGQCALDRGAMLARQFGAGAMRVFDFAAWQLILGRWSNIISDEDGPPRQRDT